MARTKNSGDRRKSNGRPAPRRELNLAVAPIVVEPAKNTSAESAAASAHAKGKKKNVIRASSAHARSSKRVTRASATSGAVAMEVDEPATTLADDDADVRKIAYEGSVNVVVQVTHKVVNVDKFAETDFTAPHELNKPGVEHDEQCSLCGDGHPECIACDFCNCIVCKLCLLALPISLKDDKRLEKVLFACARCWQSRASTKGTPYHGFVSSTAMQPAFEDPLRLSVKAVMQVGKRRAQPKVCVLAIAQEEAMLPIAHTLVSRLREGYVDTARVMLEVVKINVNFSKPEEQSKLLNAKVAKVYKKGVRHIIPLLLAHSVPNGEENAGDIHVAENAAVEPQQALEAIFGQPKELIEMKVLMMLGLCGSCFQTGEHIQMWASLAQRLEVHGLVACVSEKLLLQEMSLLVQEVSRRWLLEDANIGGFIGSCLSMTGPLGNHADVMVMRHYKKHGVVRFAAERYGYNSENSRPGGAQLDMQCQDCGVLLWEKISKLGREDGYVRSECKNCKRRLATQVPPSLRPPPGGAPAGTWHVRQDFMEGHSKE